MRIDAENGGKVAFFTALFDDAKAEAEAAYEGFKRNYAQYKGDDEIDGSTERAAVVRNITYELIESQVTSYIPMPTVTPRNISDRNEQNAKSIETLLRNKRDQLPFERMNDIDERYNPIYGGSVWLVEWDESIHTHSESGDVKVTCLPPTKFIGQPKLYDIEEMEYCFVSFETTVEEIVRRYGVTPTVASKASNEEGEDSEKTATIHICFYRNEDDNVSEYVWSGETQLLDIDDYYARKTTYCKRCGKKKMLCECEKPKFISESEEYEEIDHDIYLSDGQYIPAQSIVVKDGQIVYDVVELPAFAEDGTPLTAIDDATGETVPLMQEVQVPKKEKTRIRWYTPKHLPIVIRKNTSQEDSVFGQSDCEFIRPQQQAINKLESRIMAKMMRSGVTPVVPDSYNGSLDNSIFDRVIKLKPNEANLFGKIDTQVDISRDIAEAERLYDHAKRILGISDSFQGQYDSSAKSGVAKQVQVNQSAGRLDSKRQMKNAAYADIDRIIFEYYLAYADEPRPAAYVDGNGRLQNVVFNRYDFVERDESGEYYYDDEYMFSADASADISKDRATLWQENRLNFQSGTYGNPQDVQTLLVFWQNMERTHYPFARDNVQRMQAILESQMQQLRQQNQGLQNEIANRTAYEEYLKGEAERING